MTTLAHSNQAAASEELIDDIREAYHQLVIATREFYACTVQADAAEKAAAAAEEALETVSLGVAAAEIRLEALGVDCSDIHDRLAKFGVDACNGHHLQPMLEARRAQSENHQPDNSQAFESELPPDMAA